MWHWSGIVGFDNTADASFESFSFVRGLIDSKAMRKWDESQVLCLIGENRALSGTTATVSGSGFFRILNKV